jgi:hypothetical protein
MNVTFTLTTSNTASGPFNISGTTNGGSLNGVPIENNVSKANLLAGHTVNSILDTVTGGTITSVGVGTCNGTVKNWYVYPQTATLGYSFEGGIYYFSLSEALVDDITILIANVDGFTTAGCSQASEDTATLQGPVTITAGLTEISHDAGLSGWSSLNYINPSNQITLSTYGSISNGGTFTVPSGTIVTVSYNDTCQVYQQGL